MTKDKLKKEIKKKFGTYSRFAQMANLNYYELKRDFLDAHKPERSQIDSIEALLNSVDGPSQFTNALRSSLQEAINEQGGVIKFCSENEKFTASTVFSILSGDNEAYMRITPMIQELLTHFGIETTKQVTHEK